MIFLIKMKLFFIKKNFLLINLSDKKLKLINFIQNEKKKKLKFRKIKKSFLKKKKNKKKI